jgi:hypothetical protein
MSTTVPPVRPPRTPRRSRALEISLAVTKTRPSTEARLLPNVMIPGVSHAGAGLLSGDLGRHPQVCLPSSKRIGHFTPLRYGRDVQAPLSDYERHFSGWTGQAFRVETSPGYFDGGPAMIRTLADTLPDLRVILLLRDPSHRLWTGYIDKLARGRLPRAMAFETFIDRCLALRANGADRFEGNRYFRTLSSGYYAELLPQWLDAFGDRARVVFTEHLQDDPAAQVRALLDWLGLDPDAAAPVPDTADVGYAESLDPDPTPARRFWPVLQRSPVPWRQPTAFAPGHRVPRQSDRARQRVRSLYAPANRELAGLLTDRGYTQLPEWLQD